MKTILITGGAGFVGSQMALSFKAKYPEYEIFVMDNLKRRGSELNLPRLKSAGIHFVHGDIRNKEDFDGLPKIDCILEASAEPSVLAGIDSTPDYLVNTNLNGTINCLNFATKNKSDFIFLSTSRIYPIETIESIHYTEADTRFEIAEEQTIKGFSAKGISEEFPLDKYRSLYGTTKLASELFIQEYKQFFGLRTVINRCGVLTGPWQMGKIDQGVVVLWLAKHFWNQQLSYIGYGGKGKQVRDMLHTADLFRLIDWQMHHLEEINGEIFNVGGGREISVSLQELTMLSREVTGHTIPIHEVPENRTADIRIYITDNTKVTEKTGWKPEIGPRQIIQEIYEWMKENEAQLASILK
ncbi:MAG: NAD-dependent epimerase/dehydratase family protein [Chitinophagales bacterium]|jgi:CDP-paratose 2-epimerase|nr:NAD-dependent epimerase/dehydratase family protein [Chitinophagales bacterium]